MPTLRLRDISENCSTRPLVRHNDKQCVRMISGVLAPHVEAGRVDSNHPVGRRFSFSFDDDGFFLF